MEKKKRTFDFIEEVEELRDKFKKIVDDLDRLIELNNSEKSDEEIEEDIEIVGALYLKHLIDLSSFLLQ
ncbi:Uncharacterised protein [Clostridium perfringens]|uniref:Uncharacterized protein n=1 Tax=Clostridium perfringens TaxID=1502 RepID=A0A2X2Y2U0_CLOPF|nr:hypothetical protein [Clostridium perfringens]SQB60298.1 Uncharacterised protein [Clostridium perfringens]